MKKFQALMKSRFENAKKDNKGFSLVELIIAVVILGIIAVVAIGGLYGNVTKSRVNTDISNARDIQSALSVLSADKDMYKWAKGTSTAAVVLSWKDATEATTVMGNTTTIGSTTLGAKLSTILTDGLPTPKAGGHFDLVIKPDGTGNVTVICRVLKSDTHADKDWETAANLLKSEE